MAIFSPTLRPLVSREGSLTANRAGRSLVLVDYADNVRRIRALLAQIEARRLKLAAEGLFDADRKQPLPYIPRVIGVVTSPTGAVIRDILHRLADRFPSHVLVWPVLVQGQGAAEQVAAAVRGFSALAPDGPVPRPDLVIVARGGGSIEDLWAFNEEVVVRAIAESAIPVISAVGHETDTTLADFAADLRAPTPTAAAEIAVPVREELLTQIAELALRKRRAVVRPLQLGRERLAARVERLPRGEVLLSQLVQRLDDLSERLRRGLGDRTMLARGELQRVGGRLSLPLLSARLANAAGRLDGTARLLHSLNPDSVLGRGYVRVTSAQGLTLVSAEAARREAALTLHFRDGTIAVGPLDPAAVRPAPKPRPAPRGDMPEQGKLL